MLVKIQISNFCLLNNIYIPHSFLEVATHIALYGYNENTLKEIVEKSIFKNIQCVRNCRRKLVKLNILHQKNKKSYEINKEIGVKEGDVLYILKLFYGSKN